MAILLPPIFYNIEGSGDTHGFQYGTNNIKIYCRYLRIEISSDDTLYQMETEEELTIQWGDIIVCQIGPKLPPTPNHQKKKK